MYFMMQGERLFDANRQVLYEQTCDDIDTWITDLEKQIDSGDYGADLASVNILMQKQQVLCQNFIFTQLTTVYKL
jgi:spectrin beta